MCDLSVPAVMFTFALVAVLLSAELLRRSWKVYKKYRFYRGYMK